MSELNESLSQLDPETIEVVPTAEPKERSLEELMANGVESPIGPHIVAGSCGSCGGPLCSTTLCGGSPLCCGCGSCSCLGGCSS
jgi:hypothetical protein